MDFRVASASDFHYPIVNQKAVDWFLDESESFEANVIVLNGDLIEGKAASRHAKDERHSWTTKDELEGVIKLLTDINERFPQAHKIWLYGNHEDNILNYNAGRLPLELHEIIRFYSDEKLKPLLQYWHVIDHYKHESRWSLGQLTFRHGHDASKASIAKDVFDYCPYNGLLVMGHTHRPYGVTQLVANDVRAPFYHCNTGCMMDIPKAHYMDRLRRSNWGSGMLLAEVSAPGIMEGRKDYSKPNWKAAVKINSLGSTNFHDVTL
jgi:predicted phosphodiesterase